MFDQSNQFQINRTSLRLQKLIAHANIERTAKFVLLMICQHHNDSRGYAHPSVARLALLCGMSERSVQRYISKLASDGLLRVDRILHMRSNAYTIQEQALVAIQLQCTDRAVSIFSEIHPVDNFAANLQMSAPKGDILSTKGDISSIESDTHVTQNGINGIELKRTDEAVAVKKATVHNSAPDKPAKRIELPSSSSSSFFEELQTAVEQEALSNWQLTRIAKKRSALPTPLQCKLLVAQAREIGKPLGWIVQVMALNDWASFDKSWLQNQRPAPKLPMQESPVIDKPAPQACPATTVARAPVPNPCTSAKPDDSSTDKVAEGLAKARALLAEIRQSMVAKPVASRSDHQPKWATDAVAAARRGDYISHYALTHACQALGINYRALRAEIAASKTEAATA